MNFPTVFDLKSGKKKMDFTKLNIDTNNDFELFTLQVVTVPRQLYYEEKKNMQAFSIVPTSLTLHT